MLTLPEPTDDTPTLAELTDALCRLSADRPARWGTMDAPQMLRHCTRFGELYLGRVKVALPIRVLARALGPIFLRRVLKGSPTSTPRNLKTLRSIRATPGLELEFQEELAALRACFQEFESLAESLRHPMYGPMSAASCRSLMRHHTAHHFHQFGLLDEGGGGR